MKTLVIDNYDSFTYNLVYLVKTLSNSTVDVFRNDEIQLSEIKKYDKIILSPGPGVPKDAGLLNSIIKTYASTKSILGVCLGMQAIAESFDSKLTNLDKVYHGVSTPIKQTTNHDTFFDGIPQLFDAGRYHSWVVKKSNLANCFNITAIDDSENIMAIKHKQFDLRGVQFHPESIMTEFGSKMIANWLKENSNEELKLPTANDNRFDINKVKSNLMFC